MLPIAEYTFGEAFLTILSIFFFVIWIWILITIISDLFRDHETSGVIRPSGSSSSSSCRS